MNHNSDCGCPLCMEHGGPRSWHDLRDVPIRVDPGIDPRTIVMERHGEPVGEITNLASLDPDSGVTEDAGWDVLPPLSEGGPALITLAEAAWHVHPNGEVVLATAIPEDVLAEAIAYAKGQLKVDHADETS